MSALVVAVLCLLAVGGTQGKALKSTGEIGRLCQPCTSSSACDHLTVAATRKLQSQQQLHRDQEEIALRCHEGKCVPEAAEKKDIFCTSLESSAAALQELQARVQKGLEGLRGSTEVKLKAGRRLLAGVDGVGSTDPFAATSAALNEDTSRSTQNGGGNGNWNGNGNNGGGNGNWNGNGNNGGGNGNGNGNGNNGGGNGNGNGNGNNGGGNGNGNGNGNNGGGNGNGNGNGNNGGGNGNGNGNNNWRPTPEPTRPGWHAQTPTASAWPPPYRRDSDSDRERQSLGSVSGAGMNSWLQQSSFSDSANRPSLLQQQDDGPQSSYFQVPDDGAPKANVLAYGKGYVQLEGRTLRVIPHVQNLETCARHCDMDSQCTHWRRCAGGDCRSRLQECELMSGASNPATEAPAPSAVSRTVAPAVLQQLAPSVRYLDPAQSDVMMESGTKSPTEFPRSLYGCPYPVQPNGQVGACLPPPQCNCANGVCYGSC